MSQLTKKDILNKLNALRGDLPVIKPSNLEIIADSASSGVKAYTTSLILGEDLDSYAPSFRFNLKFSSGQFVGERQTLVVAFDKTKNDILTDMSKKIVDYLNSPSQVIDPTIHPIAGFTIQDFVAKLMGHPLVGPNQDGVSIKDVVISNGLADHAHSKVFIFTLVLRSQGKEVAALAGQVASAIFSSSEIVTSQADSASSLTRATNPGSSRSRRAATPTGPIILPTFIASSTSRDP